MTTALIGLVIFLELIEYLIIIDVILSWLTLFGLKFRPAFISNIIDPLYLKVQKYIPTNIGPMDFTPIIIIMILIFARGLIFLFFPSVANIYGSISL